MVFMVKKAFCVYKLMAPFFFLFQMEARKVDGIPDLK